MKPIRARLAITLAGFGAVLVLALLVAPLLGSTPISLTRAFDGRVPFADNVDAQIFFIARLPRVLAAALVGGALASSGAVFQALFRNPLASQDTLGVSSGASLGAVIAITFHLDLSVGGVSSVPLAGIVGAFGALGIVYALATARRRGLSTTVLLLAGVTMTAFFSALIMFAQYLADYTDTFRMTRWLMGSLDVGGYTPLAAAAPLLVAAFAMFASLPRPLDLLSLGADAASARGVNVVAGESDLKKVAPDKILASLRKVSRTNTAAAPAAEATHDQQEAWESKQRVWWYLLLVALLVLLVESFLSNRYYKGVHS